MTLPRSVDFSLIAAKTRLNDELDNRVVVEKSMKPRPMLVLGLYIGLAADAWLQLRIRPQRRPNHRPLHRVPLLRR